MIAPNSYLLKYPCKEKYGYTFQYMYIEAYYTLMRSENITATQSTQNNYIMYLNKRHKTIYTLLIYFLIFQK